MAMRVNRITCGKREGLFGMSDLAREKRGRKNPIVDRVCEIWRNIRIVSIEDRKLLYYVSYLCCLSFPSRLSYRGDEGVGV